MMIYIIALIFIVLFILFLLESSRERKMLLCKNIDLRTDKNIKPYDFLYIADFHNCNKEDVISSIEKVLDNNKDIKNVISGGDMITHGKKKGRIGYKNFFALLDKIKKYNINFIYGYGNHEKRILGEYGKDKINKVDLEDYRNGVKSYNAITFDSKKIELNENVNIYEFNLDYTFYKKNLLHKNIKKRLDNNKISEAIREDLDKNKYNIIVCHNPDFSENLIDYGFDLVLSGHHHGGLIRLPIIGAVFTPELTLFPPYTKGLYKYKNGYILVSNGIYDHSIKVRFLNIPEIYKVHIS